MTKATDPGSHIYRYGWRFKGAPPPDATGPFEGIRETRFPMTREAFLTYLQGWQSDLWEYWLVEDKPRYKYRIRHCDGNRAAWMLVCLRPDGSEVDSFGGYRTAMSIDALINSTHETPRLDPGDVVELVP